MLAVIIQFWRHVLQSQDRIESLGKTTSVAKRNPAVVANDFKSWIAVKTLDKVEQKCYTEPVILVGDDDGEVPPVPIPNTEVKLTCAEDSSLETARENR